MKGIILAGGNGSRLSPLTTAVSKQLLPVYDKPLIFYPLSTLLAFEHIRDILVICSSDQNADSIKKTINTQNVNANISYCVQENPNGLAEAFIIGEKFIGNSNVTMILGDNIFYGNFDKFIHKPTIYGVKTKYPELYGMVKFKESSFIVDRVVEKPSSPPSPYAVPGLYHFDNSVVDKAKSLKPSMRGELEIADLINLYANENYLDLKILPDSHVWFDCGNFDHLLEASNFVKAFQARSSTIIGKVAD